MDHQVAALKLPRLGRFILERGGGVVAAHYEAETEAHDRGGSCMACGAPTLRTVGTAHSTCSWRCSKALVRLRRELEAKAGAVVVSVRATPDADLHLKAALERAFPMSVVRGLDEREHERDRAWALMSRGGE